MDCLELDRSFENMVCGKFSQLFRTRLCLLNMGDPLIWAELTDNRQVSVLLFCMKWSPGLSDLAPVFRDEQICMINQWQTQPMVNDQ